MNQWKRCYYQHFVQKSQQENVYMFYLSSILITFSDSSSLKESGLSKDSVILLQQTSDVLEGLGMLLVVFTNTGDLIDSLRGCCFLITEEEEAFLERGMCLEQPGFESPFSAAPICFEALKV